MTPLLNRQSLFFAIVCSTAIAAAALLTSAPARAAGPFGLDARPANPTCVAGAAPSSGSVALQAVWPELSAVSPFAIRAVPGQANQFYVVARAGKIFRFTPGQAPQLMLDVTARVGLNNQGNAYTDPPVGSENWGLASFAFHPNFQQNGWVFLLINGRTASDPYTISSIVRYTLLPNGSALDPASGLVILTQPQPNGYLHHFGQLAFGPDGYLYIGSGDGTLNGPLYFPQIPAQKMGDLRGKILRLNVNNSSAAQPYAIPADNPFKTVAGARPEIYATGVRNPWRFTFDSVTGELWMGDVGQAEWEEVSIVPKGGNMGWNAFEGSHCRSDYTGPGTCASINAVPPVVEINHGGAYMSVTGGYVYRGSALPSLVGKYVFSLYGPQALYTITRTNTQYTLSRLLDTPAGITDFFVDAQNELYGIDPWGGKVYKLIPGAGQAGDGDIPQLLSQTGCVNPGNPKVAKGMVPFAVNSQLWSDAANKKRYAAIPDGQHIDLLADGDFRFPVGSVLMKTFLYNGKPFETRFLKYHSNGSWAGYSYEWNAAGTDATLVPREGKTVQLINNAGAPVSWTFPGRGDCMVCHTAAANFALGPETVQLNGLFTYPSTGRTANQMETWDHIGLFSGPLPAPVGNLPALADYTKTALPTAARARSYLHGNCAYCHRPDNPIRATMDLRHQPTMPEMNICNVPPNVGDLGIAGAKLFAPGRSDLSIIPARMKRRGDNQMPPMGTTVVHTQGVNIISNWIKQTQSCN